MDYTWIWNLSSAFLGAIVGGAMTIYRLGRWRGLVEAQIDTLYKSHRDATASRKEIHERLEAVPELMRWRQATEARLNHGAEQMTDIKVLAARLDETNQQIDLLRRTLTDFNNASAGTYATKDELDAAEREIKARCDERHRRRAS